MTAILLDTHALIWWFVSPALLSPRAMECISDDSAEVYASAASAWEISTKVRIGRLPEGEKLASRMVELLDMVRFKPAPIDIEHGALAGRLVGQHSDPFDRILAAQSIIEQMPIVTRDKEIANLGANTIW